MNDKKSKDLLLSTYRMNLIFSLTTLET